MADPTDEDFEFELELARAKAKAAKAKPPAPAPPAEPLPPVVQPGPSDAEKRWGRIVSFLSGSPLFGTVAEAAGALGVGGRGGSGLRRDAEQATEQFSPKVAGVPVLPVLGSVAATLPAGAARIGTLGVGAARAARVGLQGGIGAVSAADRGGDAGDVALGTGAGLVGGAAGEAGSAALTAGLRRVASGMGLRAMGARAGISESLGQRGYETVADARRLANEALEAGVVRAGRTAEDVAQQAGEHQQFVTGPLIEDAIEQANAAAARGAAAPFDFDEAAWRSAENLMRRGRPAPAPLNPQEQAAGRGAMSMVRRVAETSTPEGMGSFSEANRLKQSLQNSVNYGVNATKESTQMQRGAAAGVRQSIEEQVGRAAGPDVAETLAGANRRWGAMQDVKEVALDEARRQAQRKFPLLQTLMGAAAGSGASQSATGGLVGGGLATLGHYIGPRVPSTLAVGSFLAAPVAQRVGPYVAGAIPAVGRDVVNRSVADPLGPLRQYLELDPEEQKAASTDAFRGAP